MPHAEAPITLQCLDGATPPPGLIEELRAMADLPASVLRDYWEVLEPNLAEILDDRAGAAAARFCRDREVSREALAPCIKACRLLFRSGAALAVEPSWFGADLSRLGVAEEIIASVLLPCYDRAYAMLRQRIVSEAVAEHGNLVLGFGWRVDAIRDARQGRGLDASVALVTFHYRDGEQRRSITLQMLPNVLEQLRREIGVILG